MIGGDTGLRGGIDIFAGPPQPIGGRVGGGFAGEEDGGERTKMPAGAEGKASGSYTMFDEYGDPGELTGGFLLRGGGGGLLSTNRLSHQFRLVRVKTSKAFDCRQY